MLSWQHSFYARILFILVNIYCQPSIRFLGNLEKFSFFIMSSLDHEYNNFSLIQFLLSNIMTLVLSILTIYHCILSHFMIETVCIFSLFNIFPDSMYFFPYWHERLALQLVAIGGWFSDTFYGYLDFFPNDVCSMVILTLRSLFHVNPFYFRLSFGSP